MEQPELDRDLEKIGKIIEKMTDPDPSAWLGRKTGPTKQELC
ncbi:MAG: XamI family restriction endonuclease [Synechococcus sp. SB0678_bin_12]|nr:XamI family restriction endonuclease [Synechococcus sp. SB0678_bin_12]